MPQLRWNRYRINNFWKLQPKQSLFHKSSDAISAHSFYSTYNWNRNYSYSNGKTYQNINHYSLFSTSIKNTIDSKANKNKNEEKSNNIPNTDQTTATSLWNNMDSVKGKIGQTEFRRLWSFTKPEMPWIMKGIACMTVNTLHHY